MTREKRIKVEERLVRQRGVVARWQLLIDGCTHGEIRWLASDWRTVHDGVYVTGHAPLSDWQRWYAASITIKDSALARWSWAAAHDLHVPKPDERAHISRPGKAGRRDFDVEGHLDALHVRYSRLLEDETVVEDEIRMLTPALAILELCRDLSWLQRDRLFRDAVRTKVVARDDLRDLVRKRPRGRGVGRMKELLSRYAEIPIEQTRSDPEIEGLVVLRDAGQPLPAVNVEIAGFEADFVDLERKVITEIDGPQFHQFPVRDRERNDAWSAAGFTVVRRDSNVPYDDPNRLIQGWVDPDGARRQAGE